MSTPQPSPLSRTGGRDVHTVHFPVATPPAAVDVLVVGAGPVGLSAAIELSARGVGVAVVDRAREATLARAGAMGHTPRTVEHFRRWGVLRAIRDEWTFPPEWNQGVKFITSLVGHDLAPNPRPAFTGSATDRPRIAAEGIRRPQTALQKAFLNHLAREGVSVAGGWRVEALRETGDDVMVEVACVDSGERRTVRARYVIGADGGSSAVRSLAGIDREGERAREKRLRLIVRTGDISDRVGRAPSGTNIVLNGRADGFLAAVSDREWRVYAGPYPLDYEPIEEELLETAAAAFGFDLDLELVSATTFYAATRIAAAFRRGRVLLAGDAAHVRTPGGNLGEGFGDVTNLGWKLAAVLRGQAGEALLDSYDAERRRHNWRIADSALDSWRRGQAAVAEIRRGGIPDDADLSPVADARRAEIAAQLARGGGVGGRGGLTFDERYDASPVVWYEPGQLEDEPAWAPSRYDEDPRPGHRAPNGEVDPYGSTLYDRIGNDPRAAGGRRRLRRGPCRRAGLRRRGRGACAAVHRHPPGRPRCTPGVRRRNRPRPSRPTRRLARYEVARRRGGCGVRPHPRRPPHGRDRRAVGRHARRIADRMTRQIRLTLNLQVGGRHDAAWKRLPADEARTIAYDIEHFAAIAKIAERGRLDALFLADGGHGSLSEDASRRPWHGLEPTVLLAALAARTERIGLVATLHGIHGHPFRVARSIASLDLVSKGRAGWNIITSQGESTLEALGIHEVLDSETRYRKAEEFTEIVTGLWDSFPRAAVVGDAARDVFVDRSKTRTLDYKGEFYASKATLPIPGGHAGRPVIFQAGASDRSREFGAAWADGLFTSQRTKAHGQQFRSHVLALAAAAGRDPNKIVILPGLFVILGGTEAEARRRKDDLDAQLDSAYLLDKLAEQLAIPASELDPDAELPYARLVNEPGDTSMDARRREQIATEARQRGLTVRQLLFNNLTGGQRVIIGTPEQVADDIVDWVDSGAADGLTINIDVQTEGLETFVDGVVGELRRRGRFRTDYEHETLRENLGVA